MTDSCYKAIDYFCHLTVAPDFLKQVEKYDKPFAASEFLPAMRWLKDANADIYDPTYTDMLRVAFTSGFGRGRQQTHSADPCFTGWTAWRMRLSWRGHLGDPALTAH